MVSLQEQVGLEVITDGEFRGKHIFSSIAAVVEGIDLGLVTTKRPELECADELRSRIREASEYVPLDRLALSTQCGFASNELGNEIDVEAQRAKLELVVEVARSVWDGS